jgi:hypothetical protein
VLPDPDDARTAGFHDAEIQAFVLAVQHLPASLVFPHFANLSHRILIASVQARENPGCG